MDKRRKWLTIAIRIIGIMATFSSLCSFAVQYYNEYLPAKICVISGQEERLELDLPITGIIRHEDNDNVEMAINLSEPITLMADNITSYDLELQLLGIFDLKDVELQIVEPRALIPAGVPIGIYLETEGVMVVDIGEVEGSREIYMPAKYILQQGDYVLKVNGEALSDKKKLVEYIGQCDGESLIFTIKRGNQVFDTKVTPVLNKDDVYQLGIWIKDNVQGIGTLTYVDELGSFGALGHGIHDSDTGKVVDIRSGSLYMTDILSIKKGERGEPGELTGIIDYNQRYVLGDIYANADSGISGNCNSKMMELVSELEKLPVGYKHEVSLGPAQIVCTVDGERRYYDIEITKMHYDAQVENKGLEIKVIDEALLELTGGIVQGMSGSPVIQNGRIVGAVTHVLVNDPTRGYGIFIENMLEAAK
jgi:stage IV sporulation protein B